MSPPSRNKPPSTARELIYAGERKFKRADLFYGHGTREALDESVYLVLRGLGLPFGCPDEELDHPLSKEQIDRVETLLQQRIDTRKPAAYLLNEAYFCGLDFYVDERVLIPRSPIAELIVRGFAPWVDETRVRSVLDLCTGSGCIAIGCALAFPDATVTATDISPGALAVAAINVERHDVGDRVRLVQSDLFAGLDGERFDLIVSNPPYVPAFEPPLALAAGDDGLAIASRLLLEAGRHLTTDGVLVVEVGDREHALAERFPEVPFTWLEFERGSGVDGVFLLDAAVLKQHFPSG
jgi:ribosomal protein L3 glutamine methyltransferase